MRQLGLRSALKLPYRRRIGAGGGSGDESFSSVVLLTSFDGANGATTTTDDSNSAHSITFNGTARIDTVQSKFGGSSLWIGGGGGNFLSMADHADWLLSSANSDEFTIECWAFAERANEFECVFGQLDAPGNRRSWGLYKEDNASWGFYFSTTGGEAIGTGTSRVGSVTFNTWMHMAVSKDSAGKIRMFQDGTLIGSSTPANSAFHDSTAEMRIGRDYTGGRDFAGYIDEVRITKGVCRYGSDAGFDVPTEAFPKS